MRQDSKFIAVVALFACVSLVACGDDSSGSGPENTESSAVEESSSSIEVSSSSVNGDSGTGAGMTSSNSVDTSVTVKADTTKIIYTLKPFDGPLSNPHKGFTVPTGGAWTFVPEFEYGPYGSLNNRAWDLVSYGSGYQQWNKLNPAKGVYDWTELEKLLNALAEHNMTYALRVLPYTPSFIKSDFPPQEDYDWTPPFVYEMGAKKIQIDLRGTEYHAYAPVWDDPIYLQAAKEFAKALAEKYDGDPRIEYIDVRTFGEWGEWHTSHMLGSVMPADSVLKDMLDYYASVFKKTQLVLPSNGFGDVYTHALDLGITKRDDGFIGIPGRPDTLLRAYNANLPTIAENIAGYRTMLTYDDLIPGGSQKWTAERWVDAITTAHLTYYVLDQDNDCGYYFYKDNKALADSMSKVIGYNFTVTRAELLIIAGVDSAASTAGKSADTAAGKAATNTLNITIKNTGVAPCFFDVYLVAEFVDSTGAAIAQLGKTVRIPKASFKDGALQEFSFSGAVPAGGVNLATQPGVFVALSLYESEDAYKSGKNPTVRFDNDGLQGNNKLLLKAR